MRHLPGLIDSSPLTLAASTTRPAEAVDAGAMPVEAAFIGEALIGASETTGNWTAWLEPSGTVALGVALVALCIFAWGMNLIALPGNWVAVALLALYAWLGPQEGRAAIGYVSVGIAFAAAMAGELLEFMAAAMGAKRAGASRKSTLYAVVGSMAGAVLGAIVGVPVPVLGSILAAVLFGGVGATLGAMYGEWTGGRSWRESWSIGHAAFWGRTMGTLGKVSAGLVIVLIAIFGVAF